MMKRIALLLGCLALLLGLLLPAAAEEAAAPSTPEERLAAAREKYNAETVNIFVRGKGRAKKGKINVCFYRSRKNIPMSINIRESLQITDEYEMQAILEVITESENYSEEVYGSIPFMKAQWITHNLAHDLATGSNKQIKQWLKDITGEKLSYVISSAKELDLSPIERIPKKEMRIYRLVELTLLVR